MIPEKKSFKLKAGSHSSFANEFQMRLETLKLGVRNEMTPAKREFTWRSLTFFRRTATLNNIHHYWFRDVKTCVEGLVTKLCFQNSRKLLWCSIYSNCFRREFGSFPHSGFTKVSVMVLMWWFICFLSDSITETPQESSINDVNFPSNSWWPSAINKIETYYLILHCEKSRSNLLLL